MEFRAFCILANRLCGGWCTHQVYYNIVVPRIRCFMIWGLQQFEGANAVALIALRYYCINQLRAGKSQDGIIETNGTTYTDHKVASIILVGQVERVLHIKDCVAHLPSMGKCKSNPTTRLHRTKMRLSTTWFGLFLQREVCWCKSHSQLLEWLFAFSTMATQPFRE